MKFKPIKARFRASFSAGGVEEPRLGSIDRENEILHDVQITLEGEALGHGVWLDRAFCEACTEQGNAMGDAGVKVRFGHPAMCSDALGTYLGRAKNFRCVDVTRKDGTKAAGVIADVHLAAEAHKSPNGDLAAWVMETAENSPDTFGQSIVFTYSDFKVKDEEGTEFMCSAYESEAEWMGHSADGKVYAVLGKLHGTDFTDTPAATDGVFSSADLASEASAMMDEHPQIVATIEKNPDVVFQFLSRIGLMEKLESKRVSGIQAKMNHALDELKAKSKDEIDAAKSECNALLDAKEAASEEIKAKCQDALAALQSQCDEALAVKDARITEISANFADERAQFQAQIEEFKSQLKEIRENLAAVESARSTLEGELEHAKADLAHTGEQLAGANERLAMLGHDVNRIPDENALSLSSQLASLPMSEREAFFKAHAREFKKIKK